jgi:hypothetical protein
MSMGLLDILLQGGPWAMNRQRIGMILPDMFLDKCLYKLNEKPPRTHNIFNVFNKIYSQLLTVDKAMFYEDLRKTIKYPHVDLQPVALPILIIWKMTVLQT